MAVQEARHGAGHGAGPGAGSGTGRSGVSGGGPGGEPGGGPGGHEGSCTCGDCPHGARTGHRRAVAAFLAQRDALAAGQG
ncbi:hypothetical protein ACFV09_42180, partial [Streptomyces sp. NPDC059631]